ncbi:MAG: hypothetical protein O9282_13155 [Flavobacterium sp.]|jgi:hypothetical protein|uniref:hypothetical protein n=1 Tax=Flavobacterium sp. TaxID=239 RepID=UPI0022C39150|nr:hypothetical protein [Flavobacterium sp.]MCZ8023353.1 hypothetical protein [Cytophagales bacterium]MCZ8332253.1 hypothetical protein [Flavobacterium sp.]
MEFPNSIFIEINKGEVKIERVLKDILALTKLNYNACIYADGVPVTLRFADKNWRDINRKHRYKGSTTCIQILHIAITQL